MVWQRGACPLPTPPEGAGTEGAGHVILKHSPATHHFLKPAHGSQGGGVTRSISEASRGVTGPGEDQFPTEGLRWGSPPSPSSNLTSLLSPSCKLTQLPMSGETAKRGPVGTGQKPKVHTHPQEGLEGRTRVGRRPWRDFARTRRV